MTDLTDEDIRKMAKERVAFKQHALVYVLVNALLVAIWATSTGAGGDDLGWRGFWPMWSLLFWGFGLVLHGVNAYSDGQRGMLAREEEKLRRKYRH